LQRKSILELINIAQEPLPFEEDDINFASDKSATDPVQETKL